MLSLPRRTRVFVDMRPFDMRGHFRSMVGRVRAYGLEPADGHIFLFVSKNRKMAAVFTFDGSGWCQYRKRLERGTFELPTVRSGIQRVTVEGRVINAILDGVELGAPRRRWFERPPPPGS